MERAGNLFIIFKKEVAGYFNSAIAYIFMIIFALLNGGLFMTHFFLAGRADMRSFFLGLPIILCIFLPAVSMRLWAEERRGNTHELLLTFPVKPHELVLGKFFASLFFYILALLCTLPIPAMLIVLGHPDLGVIFSGYAGAVLLGCFFLAVGILISGFYRDQIVAFILSMMICFGFYFIGTEMMASLLDGWVAGLGTFFRHYVGASDHYFPFCKGVIDNRNIIYFFVGSIVCLTLNGFWIEGRMRPKARSIFTSAVLLCAGIFLATNWLISGIQLGRFDLTDGKLYTVSPASKEILQGLKSPVTAKFYISSKDKMPTSMKALEQDVRDKLDEFQEASDGKFQYKVFHMDAANIAKSEDEKEKTLEEQLSQKGVQPFRVESIQSDELGVRLIYSAISLSYKEKPEEVLPRIYPATLHELEYALLSKIYRMTLPEVPAIALVAPFEDKSLDPNLVAFLEQLGASGQIPSGYKEDAYEFLELGLEYEGYPVSRIDPKNFSEIPEETQTLVVVEPRKLGEAQKRAINEFLHQGGSLFLAVQNYEFNYHPTGAEIELIPSEKDPAVNDLLSAWGFTVDTQVLADEQTEAISLSRGQGALFNMAAPVRFPVQILLTAMEMNEKISITSRLPAIFYLWGSALKIDQEKVKAQDLRIDTLLTSSQNSWIVPFKAQKMTRGDLARLPASPKGPFQLAVLVQGQFADAYKGIPVSADASSSPETEAAADKEGKAEILEPSPGKLLLMGAATPFQKQLIQGGGHMNFFLNSIDALALGDALTQIRSKAAADRTLPKVSRASKIAWRFFVTLLVPILIALAGAAHFFWRRRSQQRYLKSLRGA